MRKTIDTILFGTPFKIMYLILVMLSFNSITQHTKYLTVYTAIILGLGVLQLAYRAVFFKNYIKTKYLWILGLLLLGFVISGVLNMQYGFLGNFKAFLWFAIQIGILYACNTNEDPERYKKEFFLIGYVFIIYETFSLIVSFIMLFAHYGAVITDPGTENITGIIGFVWLRLWGLYSDPNYGGVAVIVASIICVYFLLLTKRIWLKVLYGIFIAMSVCYVAMGDSRTALVSGMVGFGMLTYFYLLRAKPWRNKSVGTRQMVAILFTCLVMVSLYGATVGVQKTYNTLNKSSGSSHYANDPEAGTGLVGDRKELKSDPSNHRFDLWKSGLVMFEQKPAFGVSFRNLLPYAKANAPDTYLAQENFLGCHNVYIDILVSQGAVGALIALAFLILIVVVFFTNIFKFDDKYYYYVVALGSMITTLAVSGLFLSDIFYVNSVGTFLFWLCLGYLVHICRHREKPKNEKEGLHMKYAKEKELSKS